MKPSTDRGAAAPAARLNLGSLPVAFAFLVALFPARASAQFVELTSTPFSGAERLIERTVHDVAFTLTLKPGKKGPRVPPVTYPIEILVCEGTGASGSNCVAFNELTPTVSRSGNISLRLPLAGPDVAIQLVACAPSRDANQALVCGERVYGRAEFKRPIFARFEVGIDSFTINHTRARTSDTVYLGYAGLFAQKIVDEATSSALKACDNIIGPASVEKPILCRNLARYGVNDLRDGTYPGRQDLGVGVFELIPGAGGRLNFGYVLFNFGFPGEPAAAKDSMIGNSWNTIYGQLVSGTGQHGVFEVNPMPREDITRDLDQSPWLGCDGPTAGGVFTIANDDSPEGLDALTSGSGRWISPKKEFVVESQAGCGESSRYGVAWSVRRTTW